MDRLVTNESRSNRDRRYVSLLVLWSVFLWTLWKHYKGFELVRNNGFETGDWLINYEGGFVRRGLIGQIVYGLSKYVVHARATQIVLWVEIAAYVGIAVGVTYLSFKKKPSRWLPWVLLAPTGLLFIATNEKGGYRKEELFFLAVVCLAVAITCKPLLRKIFAGAGVGLFFVALLSWEGCLFFLPSVVVLLGASLGARARRWALPSVVAGSLACGLLLARFHGDAGVAAKITNSLTTVGAPASVGSGSIQALKFNLSDAIRFTIFDPHHDPRHYFYGFLLSVVPFVFSGWVRRHKTFFAITLLFALPQYVIASDYGRWIHALVICLTLHWLTLDREGYVLPWGWRIPRWGRDAALLLWCSTWSMGFCDEGLRRDLNLLTQAQSMVDPGADASWIDSTNPARHFVLRKMDRE